jgi:hypothetical protein
MFDRIQRNLAHIMAHMLQMSPNQQLRSMVLVLVFLLLVNMASSAILEVLDLPPGLTLLLLPLLLVLILAWNVWRSPRRPPEVPPKTGEPPEPHPGMIFFLSLFQSSGNKQVAGLGGEDWRREQLARALETSALGWPIIIERFEKSNMRPLLEAVRHHSQGGTLKHVWLISTLDIKGTDGKVIQEGSEHLAPLIEKVMRGGLRFETSFHHEDPRLKVPSWDVTAAYKAVEYVYTVATQQAGLLPDEVIGDLTGGRVPMTGGMILACAPRGWKMQYTTTDRDPAQKGPGDRPVPVGIVVDAGEIRRRALEALYMEMERTRGKHENG